MLFVLSGFDVVPFVRRKLDIIVACACIIGLLVCVFFVLISEFDKLVCDLLVCLFPVISIRFISHIG